MSMDYEQVLTDIVRPLAEPLGLVLWGIEILGSTRPLVRIYVDVPDSAETDVSGSLGNNVEQGVSAMDFPPSFLDATKEVTEEATGKASKVAKQGKTPNLSTGVSIEQCTRLSRRLSLALDVEAPFAVEWVLEVSSPGFNRPFFSLEQLPPYMGMPMEVVLASSMDMWPGRKKFSGTLMAVAEETLSLSLPEGTHSDIGVEFVEIPWQHVRKMHLVHSFEAVDKKAGSLKLLQQARQK